MTDPPPAPVPRFAALRSPHFAWLWVGLLVSYAGTQADFVARSWLVLERTDSPLAGAFGLAWPGDVRCKSATTAGAGLVFGGALLAVALLPPYLVALDNRAPSVIWQAASVPAGSSITPPLRARGATHAAWAALSTLRPCRSTPRSPWLRPS